jgi:sulfhydrogenase subunit delta
MSGRPRLGVFKFASCDGCQLSVLNAEDELLDIAAELEIVYFLEASSHYEPGPYDVALVEGSITTREDEHRIREIRDQTSFLITIGACATAGGIQALRNWADCDEFIRAVYPDPQYISTLSTSTAIADHVPVDFELRGCPINTRQLVEVISSLLKGCRPRTPVHSVCLDCKRRGNVCITVAQGIPCLGPITQSGCGALCPTFDRGCYGCYGPARQPNPQSLTDWLVSQGASTKELVPLLRNFNGNAPEFRRESNRLEGRSTDE